jgi:hypothetical protein
MMKIDQEDFNRKAQHILDTVVKPQVEKYEKAKADGELIPPPPSQLGASEFLDEEHFLDLLLKASGVPRKYFGKKEEEQ